MKSNSKPQKHLVKLHLKMRAWRIFLNDGKFEAQYLYSILTKKVQD